MVIDVGSGNKNVNFHQGGGKKSKVEERKAVTYTDNGTYTVDPDDGYDAIKGADVTVDVDINMERGSKAWWEKVLKGNIINGIFYNEDNLTDVLYSQESINSFFDSSGNEMTVYDKSGNQIENHLGQFQKNGRYDISLYHSVNKVTFSDLVNGTSERSELIHSANINELNGIDNNNYDGIIINPTAYITYSRSGNVDYNYLRQYRLLPIFYYEENEKYIRWSQEIGYNITSDKYYASVYNNSINEYEVKDFSELTLNSMNIYNMSNYYELKSGGENTLGEYVITNSHGSTDYGIPDFFSKINKVTIKSQDCSYALYNKGRLLSVDMSSADTSSVTNMSSMFDTCYALTSLDLSSFDTTSVTDMSRMFRNNNKLTIILLSSKFFNSTRLRTYDFSGATAWTDAHSLAVFIDALPQLTSTKTVKLSTNTKNALTDEQKTTISDKGWTIA